MTASSMPFAPRRVIPMRRAVMVPLGLAVVYVVVLALRFPALIGWLNNNLDVGGAYMLATALAHGHTGGHVVVGTQGAWVSLAWAVLTFDLPDHRVIWEISPALASLASALILGATVARLAGRIAGAFSVTLMLVASPSMLWILTAPWMHNTTFLGVALLGAYLVWLSTAPRSKPVIGITALAMSLTIGLFVASDQLLEPTGLIPFALAPVLLAVRARDCAGLAAVVAVVAGSALVAATTNAGMHAAGYVTTAPQAHLALSMFSNHLTWLIQGFARLGNGSVIGPLDTPQLLLTMAAALGDGIALLATAHLTIACIAHPGTGRERARAMHITFWACTIVCASAAYLFTNVATGPADRYIAVVIPAIAAVIPFVLHRPRAATLTVVCTSAFFVASLVGLANQDAGSSVNHAIDQRQADRLANLVAHHHLGVGFAGYSDAGPLDWESDSRLHLHPVQTNADGQLIPSTTGAVASWYRPQPGVPSYLVLSRDNQFLSNELPPDLPLPEHSYRVGELTVVVWPFDIATTLGPALN